jgi:hypothetical protein
MLDKKGTNPQGNSNRVALTVRLSLQAYDAITELQRKYRKKTGKFLPLWKLLDSAIVAYARQKGIKFRK